MFKECKQTVKTSYPENGHGSLDYDPTKTWIVQQPGTHPPITLHTHAPNICQYGPVRFIFCIFQCLLLLLFCDVEACLCENI